VGGLVPVQILGLFNDNGTGLYNRIAYRTGIGSGNSPADVFGTANGQAAGSIEVLFLVTTRMLVQIFAL
jgi:hypothetical protein